MPIRGVSWWCAGGINLMHQHLECAGIRRVGGDGWQRPRRIASGVSGVCRGHVGGGSGACRECVRGSGSMAPCQSVVRRGCVGGVPGHQRPAAQPRALHQSVMYRRCVGSGSTGGPGGRSLRHSVGLVDTGGCMPMLQSPPASRQVGGDARRGSGRPCQRLSDPIVAQSTSSGRPVRASMGRPNEVEWAAMGPPSL